MRNRMGMIQFVVLAMLAIGGAPALASIWSWSTTAGNNATADPSINWSEGMSPSSVNDSARAMMASLAAWRNDISTKNTTAGTSTAYTLTTSEGVDTTPATGQMLAFIAHATNGASPTLQADGGTSYTILLNGSALGAGTLVAGTPYRVGFNGTNWILEGGLGNPYNVSLGQLMYSTISSPPNSNFIVPAGQCISTTTYATYWVALGSPASGACAGGQFAVIDHRGRVPAGLDNIGGSAANRLTSASTGCGTAFTTMGVSCTNALQGQTLGLTNLPAGITSSGSNSISVTVTPATPVVAVPAAGFINGATPGTGGGNVPFNGSSTFSLLSSMSGTTSNSIAVTSNNTGSGGNSVAHPVVDPNIGLYVYMRVI